MLNKFLKGRYLNKILSLINRKRELFIDDLKNNEKEIHSEISESRFLVIGGGGSIGRAVVKEIFKRHPIKLHVVDLSENNLVELVRDIRSSYGYIKGDFNTFAIDFGGKDFVSFFNYYSPYDYVLNLAALKHVRSERDAWTLMRMIDVNIRNNNTAIDLAALNGTKKYFCISTDKSANPVNLMGATKRIMEMCLLEKGILLPISTARFANVAFSDGSLLDGFKKRIEKNQPLAAPSDIERYFVSSQEAGILCILSSILGKNSEIFFPKIGKEIKKTSFKLIIEKYLGSLGLKPQFCESEREARLMVNQGLKSNRWPVFLSESNTTGEKELEEFFTMEEATILDRFMDVGIVSNSSTVSRDVLNSFFLSIDEIRNQGSWDREQIIEVFRTVLPYFNHLEKNKFLDQKM